MQDTILYLVPALAVVGLIYMFIQSRWVRSQSTGEEKMSTIAKHIHEGALAFLSAEYRILAVFVVVAGALLGVVSMLVPTTHWFIVIAFVIGAVFSALAGNIGMRIATEANVRTTQAARTGLAHALKVSFTGGMVMGLGVAGLAVFGLSVLFIFLLNFFAGGVWTNVEDMTVILEALAGFSLGAESIALFARVGGGIYTKAADVGADLVGKVEAGIPEDDPRNPAVIADNVGDNVGDVAGMGSDIFESYCGSMIASIALAASMSMASVEALGGDREVLQFMPLVLASTGLICSLLGILSVRMFADRSPDVALRFGTIGSAVIFIVAAYFVITSMG
ncbi:MAG: sodium/proton-translocating pyrophosphatase, partial [Flavobacteriales bacterium]